MWRKRNLELSTLVLGLTITLSAADFELISNMELKKNCGYYLRVPKAKSNLNLVLFQSGSGAYSPYFPEESFVNAFITRKIRPDVAILEIDKAGLIPEDFQSKSPWGYFGSRSSEITQGSTKVTHTVMTTLKYFKYGPMEHVDCLQGAMEWAISLPYFSEKSRISLAGYSEGTRVLVRLLSKLEKSNSPLWNRIEAVYLGGTFLEDFKILLKRQIERLAREHKGKKFITTTSKYIDPKTGKEVIEKEDIRWDAEFRKLWQQVMSHKTRKTDPDARVPVDNLISHYSSFPLYTIYEDTLLPSPLTLLEALATAKYKPIFRCFHGLNDWKADVKIVMGIEKRMADRILKKQPALDFQCRYYQAEHDLLDLEVGNNDFFDFAALPVP